MSDKRAYCKLDVGYFQNPKIAPLLDETPVAALLHLACIAYATQHATNGVVPVRLAMRQACAQQSDLDALLHAGLLIDIDGKSVEVHDYLEHQRSASEVKTASDKAREAARARWDKEKGDAPSIASSNAEVMPQAMQREKERKKEEPTRLADASLLSDFDIWWDTYGYKKARPAALKAYKAARKHTDAATLLAGAEGITRQYGKTRTFCPYPATWLNQQRWGDEITTEPEERDPNAWMQGARR